MAAGVVLQIAARRFVPDENGAHGLVVTLVGLAVDASVLVGRMDSATQWVELEDAAEHALGVAVEVVVLLTLT